LTIIPAQNAGTFTLTFGEVVGWRGSVVDAVGAAPGGDKPPVDGGHSSLSWASPVGKVSLSDLGSSEEPNMVIPINPAYFPCQHPFYFALLHPIACHNTYIIKLRKIRRVELYKIAQIDPFPAMVYIEQLKCKYRCTIAPNHSN
jgi:hypothetical protein